MKYNPKNQTIEQELNEKGFTSAFKRPSVKQLKKISLLDPNMMHKCLSPRERILYEINQHIDFESQMISKSLNSLPIRSRKTSNDKYLPSFEDAKENIDHYNENTNFTANFWPQDVDRFGRPLQSKKANYTNPGPGSYSQERFTKTKGGVLPKSKRKFEFMNLKQGPGPWYYKNTLEPKHISFRLENE